VQQLILNNLLYICVHIFVCDFNFAVDICDYDIIQSVNQTLFVCRDLMNHTTFFTLSFKDGTTERDYNLHKESFSSISVMGCPLVLLITSTAQFVVLPRSESSSVAPQALQLLLQPGWAAAKDIQRKTLSLCTLHS
jgi:hypothetical protein